MGRNPLGNLLGAFNSGRLDIDPTSLWPCRRVASSFHRAKAFEAPALDVARSSDAQRLKALQNRKGIGPRAK
jgi:hypothetical protein